jgi:hypothetical protein
MYIELKTDSIGNTCGIIGWCILHPSDKHEQRVISFTRYTNLSGEHTWSTSSSTCLPSDVASAKRIIECYNLAYKELENYL